MEFGLKDKVAIVTGSSKGMGLAITQAYLNEGVKVMLDILQVEKFSDYKGELKTAIRTLDQAVKA